MRNLRKILFLFLIGSVIDTAYAVGITPISKRSQTDADQVEATPIEYSVSDLQKDNYEELTKQNPYDLKDPENVKTEVEYDPANNCYIIRTKVGDKEVATPFTLSSDEYQEYSLQKEMQKYWAEKNSASLESYDSKFNLSDIKFNIGPADKIFGPGGVQLKTQGSAEITFGILYNKINNPAISEKLRKSTTFDFDENIQLSVNGKVGNKVNFNLNYNTESTFDFDKSMLKLAYSGKEDEIVRKLEAGNVSMPVNSTLIKGSSALFGVKTELQFGKLNITAVVSQQQSESQTVNSKGGTQLKDFEVNADEYDENRHFFLAHYFRDNYERSMKQLPLISSGITVNRVEVWVTNKRGNYEQARNITAFMDLGENKHLNNSYWNNGSTLENPSNVSNRLYSEMSTNAGIRDIQTANTTLYLLHDMVGGEDYECIESARRLDASEYTFNAQLGYISLQNALNADEVLAVAFEYTYGGNTYQVGEFSTDAINPPQSLVLKLLKGSTQNPKLPMWDLMMKNVYYLGASRIQQEKFRLDIQYRDDATGVYLNYISEGNIKNKLLVRALGLDRLDSRNEAHPDGSFDYVEGFTINPSTGRIYFPLLEPFGEGLRKVIGNDAIAKKYIFQELYDSTLVVAQELSEKNKFKLVGKYKASSNSEIQLNAMNVARGSVTVTAGGRTLTENVDYVVDYIMGTVTILDEALLASGTNIEVSLENQSAFNLQRKTMVGTHLEYAFNKDFSIGATVMHLSEMPLVTKVAVGSEPISNTIWGVNVSYKTEAPWLTNFLNKLPLLNLSQESNISFNAEVAQLIPGHRKVENNKGFAYLDDFETSETSIDVSYPYYWKLSSTPSSFSEAMKSNDIEYGKNRALLSWYSIDNSVFNRNNSTTPSHLRQNKDALSNHLTREVLEQEIFPNREAIAGETSYLSVLNLSFYPSERGPYNLDATNINSDGYLLNPETRWGGIMRKLDVTNFETSNIEYIEFWMMDPFVNDSTHSMSGGDLYIDLGDVSEDILKDGKKFFENGLSAVGDTTSTYRTVWGIAPKTQSTVVAFSNDDDARLNQDVGLNGLKTEQEKTFPTYKNYVEQYRSKLSAAAFERLRKDPFSAINDPAGDNFHHYRGSDYDSEEKGILERYKHYNGTEGNSLPTTKSAETYSTSATTSPDVEDLNGDNTLNEYEKYFEYKISTRREDLEVGKNFINDKIVALVELKNGQRSEVTWYQFKIPIHEYNGRYGSIRDFRSIRFMRMFMYGYSEETHLRFGTLRLVRGDWRIYTKDLYDVDNVPITNGTIDVSAVSIEENSNKKPVNYLLPPGVTRETDPSQPQLRQQNEQSMQIKVQDLAPGDARAVYKNLTYDLRQYGRLQMFAHAEQLIDDAVGLKDNEISVFLRMGTDNTNNYYEYEVPLKVTHEGVYATEESEVVWPDANMLDIPLTLLTKIKNNRNREKSAGRSSISFTKPYSEYDPEHLQNKVTVLGNPNLGDIQVLMIGVRNNGREAKSAEVWVDELRLSDYNEKGGWGAVSDLSVNFSDFGNFNIAGRIETAGFGGLEDNVQDRNMENIYQLQLSTAFELGKLFPEKANVKLPIYVSYSNNKETPKYNPFDEDILLKDALDALETEAEKEELEKKSVTQQISKSVNLTNVKVDYSGKKPHIYDPANFSISYAYNETENRNPETEYDISRNHQASFNYDFSTTPKPWEPFKKLKNINKPAMKIFKDFGINYQPNRLGFSMNLARVYSEMLMRDLTGSMEKPKSYADNTLLSFCKDFTIDRKFDFKYDLTKNLKFSFASATNCRVDETKYAPVNKEFYPDEYEVWKDTVLQSLKTLGRPLTYQQMFSATYSLPINKIPYLEWITANGQYNTTYNWDRGIVTEEDLSVGNTISNINNWQVDGQLNFETLYNKSEYLRNINRRYASGTPSQSQKKFKEKKYNISITLKKGEPKVIRHNLNSNNLKVNVTDADGKSVKLKYKKLNKNEIELTSTRDIKGVAVNIKTVDPNNLTIGQKVGQFSLRFLMMVRRVSVSYKESNSLLLPGFMNDVTFFGQGLSNKMLSPGLDFSFGIPGKEYINKAMEKKWLTDNDSIITPASITKATDLDIKANLEPIPGMKISLTAKYVTTLQNTIQYTYEDMPTTFVGSFRMTHVAIGSSFWSIGNEKNNYASKAYEKMKQNRQVIQQELESKYTGTLYPANGFMKEHPLRGQRFNSSNGTFGQNSSDVLIPAFFAAYSNRSLNKVEKTPFPSLRKLLPNWSVSYDGLSRIKGVQKYFKSISLNHAYQCTYNVGSYTSFANYTTNEDGLGFVADVLSGDPIPSSQYDVSSVSINEMFNPLIGLDIAMKNSLTVKFEYRKQRNLTLNLSSVQLIETASDEFVFGVGYVVKDFDIILKLKNRTSKVKNNLTTRLDFSYKDTKALIRKITTDEVQPTSGNKTISLKLSADYVFSSRLNFRLFFDYQMNNPLISTSYPVTDANVGFSIRFMLTR